jgi:lysophospholipid acyltransferase (LPLAT)-like uncharacterized protein
MTTLYDRVGGNILYLLAQMINRTCRFQCSGYEHFQGALSSGRPTIAASWHGMALMLISFASYVTDLNSFVIIHPSDSRGGTLSIYARRLGTTPFPLDLEGPSNIGMAKELAKVVRLVVAGHHTYIAPDGPDGPAHVVKPGVTYIARKADALILPLGAYARHGYRIPRWDRRVIPYPFSRIAIHACEPYSIPPGADLDAANEHLTNLLLRAGAQAEADYYERPAKRGKFTILPEI